MQTEATPINAGDMAHFFHGDTLVDWLDRFGRDRGFIPDNERAAYDRDTDMALFLQQKGAEFKRALMRCLRHQEFQVHDLHDASLDPTSPEAIGRTIEAMRSAIPLIANPVLADPGRGTYGLPAFLMRSDVVNRIFQTQVLTLEEIIVPAAELDNAQWHYRVVDIKFSRLPLGARDGFVLGGGSTPARKGQLLVCNRALGILQGFEPDTAYIIGRGTEQTIKGDTTRTFNCFERICPVDMNAPDLIDQVDAACAWIRRLNSQGHSWQVLPTPTVPELRPNTSSRYDYPWHYAKAEIADTLRDPILLWQVGASKRDAAVLNGFDTFDHPHATANSFGISGAKQQPVLDAILAMARSSVGPKITPDRITTEREIWGEPRGVEFYVDFETVSNLDDEFSAMPQMGGQPLIFMIGCGHVENGHWTFKCFTADLLTEDHEATIVDDWISHMREVTLRLSPSETAPLCFHWSPAEDVSFLTQYNSACARQPLKNWPQPNWYDFLVRVVRPEPVVVKNALNFGLKPLAKAMFKHGFIAQEWTEGPGDGLAAMVGAWRCHHRALAEGRRMVDLPLMQGIEKYNEVDCRVMQEIVQYLRDHH